MNNNILIKDFAQLLADTEDLLKHGFRTEHPELEFSGADQLNPADSLSGRQVEGDSVHNNQETLSVTLVSGASAGTERHGEIISGGSLEKDAVKKTGNSAEAGISGGDPGNTGKIRDEDPTGNQDKTNTGSGGINLINKEIAACKNCNLYLIRNNAVFGKGSENPVLMIIAPPPYDGAPENGNPMLPYEEEYLNKWLKAVDIDPEKQVFITPCVKCRTPGGRNPYRDEVSECSSFLRRQYKELKPKAVLALGDAACGALTGNSNDFPSLVAADWTWGAVPALVLWTPAEVLTNPEKFRKPVWLALQKLKEAWSS